MDSDATDLELLKRFRRCAHLQRRMSRFQGQAWLLILLKDGPMTQRELGEITLRRAATLCEQLDLMEASGWITREKDAADRRSVLVRLTGAGQAAEADAEAERARIAAALFSGLGAEDRARLGEILSALEKSWSALEPGSWEAQG